MLPMNIPINPPAPISFEKDALENIRCFRRQWKHYSVITGMDKLSEEVKTSFLHLAIGRQASSIIDNLLVLSDDEKRNSETILSALENHHLPRNEVIHDRHDFNRLFQKPDESIDDFANHVRRLAVKCEFNSELLNFIRDRFLVGLYNANTKNYLSTKSDLTFEDAYNYCKANEETTVIVTSQVVEDELPGNVESNNIQRDVEVCGSNRIEPTIKMEKLDVPLPSVPLPIKRTLSPPAKNIQLPKTEVKTEFPSNDTFTNSFPSNSEPTNTFENSFSSNNMPTSTSSNSFPSNDRPPTNTLANSFPSNEKPPTNIFVNSYPSNDIPMNSFGNSTTQVSVSNHMVAQNNYTPPEYDVGSYVVLKSDLKNLKGDAPIWRIDSTSLLQKFTPCVKNGELIYKSSAAYNGWSSSYQALYDKVQVTIHTKQVNQKEITVKLKDNIFGDVPIRLKRKRKVKKP